MTAYRDTHSNSRPGHQMAAPELRKWRIQRGICPVCLGARDNQKTLCSKCLWRRTLPAEERPTKRRKRTKAELTAVLRQSVERTIGGDTQ